MSPPRIAIFVDGPNFFYLQKDNWFIDPKKIITWAERKIGGEVVDARYYQSVDPNPELPPTDFGFLKALPHMGYSVHKRNVKTLKDDEGDYNVAQITTPMMLDICESKSQFDVVIIVSGSGEFEEVADRMKTQGKRVMVLSTLNFISGDLRAKVGRGFIDFDSIKAAVVK